MIAALEHERRIERDLLAGLINAPFAAADETGQDQRLRLCPAFGETLLH